MMTAFLLLLCIVCSVSALRFQPSGKLISYRNYENSWIAVVPAKSKAFLAETSSTKLFANENRKITREDEGDFFETEVNFAFRLVNAFNVRYSRDSV